MLRSKVTRTDDSGAAAVEFALVALLLFTILFGIIEYSLLMRDNVSVSSLVRAGARTASAEAGQGHVTSCPTGVPGCTLANIPQLAQDAADAVQRSGSAMPKGNIDELWIYKANASGFPGDSSVTTWAAASCAVANCVKFVWVDLEARFQYASGSWTSTTIAACAGTGGADSVGVIMKGTHPWLLNGLFGRSVSMYDRAVMQFEPLANSACASGAHP